METNLNIPPATGLNGEKERIRKARLGLLVFFALVIPLSTLCYWLIPRLPFAILLLMWAPGISSIITRLVLREGTADISLRFGGRHSLKTLPFILLFPVVIGLIAYGIAWGAGLVEFAAPETFFEASPVVMFLVILLFQMVVGTAVGLITSTGEELGWRGYMTTRMMDARVPYPLLTSGIIWGLWHLPVILMGDYYSGPYPALSVIFFMISCTSFGYIVGRIRMTTGSLWPAILLHSSWNAIAQDAFDAFSKGENALLWTGESGIIVALVFLAAAWIISKRPLKIRHL
ncbi:CPBP family intramembrane glutamic endopeptidase [Paenibacillus pinihumi]|uniref:CPBP family intramembrane glutamic endopeptidase n=1 Tax=Paenibacillus pinihumi TaxID=669462 RepID=UPI00040F716D|nr:CPBP family intramembrane glutamic endopeptidase [Paenibacillus pinihumi]